MSGLLSESLPEYDPESPHLKDGHTEQNQEHFLSRLSHSDGEDNTVMMDETNEHGVEEVGTDISAGQKMLSAVSGSLLTSLLGRYDLP